MAPSSWTNAPLTSFDLEAAFQHYFGDKVSHEDWVEPGQVQMQGKHEVVEKLIDALKKFRSPESGGKQPVYTHAKAQLVLTALTTSSPGPVKAPPSPQNEKSFSPAPSEPAQRQDEPNPNAAYNQGNNQNYRPAVQAQNYSQDPQGLNQSQQGFQPGYAQAQGNPNYGYAYPQQHARTPYPAVSILMLHRPCMLVFIPSCALDDLSPGIASASSATRLASLVELICLLRCIEALRL